MKKYFLFILIIFSLSINLYATHNRAGEIVYRHISGYKYEITIYTYTFTASMADRDSLETFWGDNTSNYVKRVQKNLLPDEYQQNIYVGLHTYPGPGTYQIIMEDPNRNDGVLNIPNSVNVVFALKTILQINFLIGANNTPVLLNMPIDKAAKGEIFIHNPGAFDPDGDSLSYKMAVCLFDGGAPIPDFTLPTASTNITVDQLTGDLIWDTPVTIGIYNVAMEIEEWRNNVKISSIIRDIQIEVYETDNNPPDIYEIPDMCVEADSLVKFAVKAEDPDEDYITLSAVSGVFELDENPAYFATATGYQTVVDTFRWQTCCNHIQKQPYRIIFKAIDDSPEIKLVDYENVAITVVGPATEIVTLEPSNSTIFLRWKKNRCENVIAYKLYRKKKIDTFEPVECQTGIPESAEYTLIAEIDNIEDTTYLDNDNGLGLSQGFLYCYRVVCVFTDGAEGYTSEKMCTDLIEGSPVFTKVNVNHTDIENGAILLEWLKPRDLDTLIVQGPFKYSIYYSRDLYGGFYQGPIDVEGYDNLSVIDTIFNTKDNPSTYKLQLLNYDVDNNHWNAVGPPSVASSVFLKTQGADSKAVLTYEANVPWENNEFIIYRQNKTTFEFDSIGYTTANAYIDFGLKNGEEYCYKVKSKGFYSADEFPKLIENFSQIACVTPIDTVAPCPVNFEVSSECELERNKICWNLKPDSCFQNIDFINIYYTNQLNGELSLIQKVENPNDTCFYHYPELTLAACYSVTAVDSAGNESSNDYTVCTDICHYYELPNVFTPNGDALNELYHPLPYKFVEKIKIQIYNRWGGLVFESEDPDINWNGKDMYSDKLVSDGVYYYICDVYEYRLSGLQVRNLSGFIHIYGNASVPKP